MSAFGGEPIIKIFSGKRVSLFRIRFPDVLRLVLVDRVLTKVISEIKNGWLRIQQM